MTLSQDDVIQIHHALHGYSEGHRLLEASFTLPREVERAVLVFSDMSGPSMLHGFESYLTGYPLAEVGLYAFAKTWYAAEMPRPGCVWTHTLFIENADLARIQDLRTLLELFQRPEKGRAWLTYKTPSIIPVHLPLDNGNEVGEYSTAFAARTLAALYGSPNNPIYITADVASYYESLVLRLWTQQWPRLRRAFRFCTGSLANRRSDGKTFDLQIVPPPLVRQLGREERCAEFVSEESYTDVDMWPLWLRAAMKDLFAESAGLLRQFLWTFGADIEGGRATFAPLAQVFCRLEEMWHHDASLNNVTEAVRSGFPVARDASALKISIFGDRSKRRLLPKLPESELLRELATTKHYQAFDAEMLDISNRAGKLWTSHPDKARNLAADLILAELTPLGEKFLTGLAEVLRPDDAVVFFRTHRKLFSILAMHNPALFTSFHLWDESLESSHFLLELMSNSQSLTPEIVKSTVFSILKAGVGTIADDVVKRFGDCAVAAVLDWVNTSPSTLWQNFQTPWRHALASRPAALLVWLQETTTPEVSTVAFIASLLDPTSLEVQSAGTDVWLRFSATTLAQLDRQSFIKAMAFLLAFALKNPEPGAAELAARSFEAVHNAARDDELDADSWRFLRDQVPPVSWWRDWDKCERLRRALVECFLRYDWPIEHFLQAASDEAIFSKIVDYCEMTRSGRSFLEKVAKLIVEKQIYATDKQRTVLRSLL